MIGKLALSLILAGDSVKTLKDLAPLLGGVIGGAGASKLDIKSAFNALQGKGEPPKWLMDVKAVVDSVLSSGTAEQLLPVVITRFSAAQGVTPDRLVALCKDLARVLDLSSVDSVDGIAPLLRELSERLQPFATPQIRAACTCARCGFFQFVSS